MTAFWRRAGERVWPDAVLVAGATSGIGGAFADACVRHTRVIATGRDEAKLEALVGRHPARITPIVADLTSAADP